MWQKVANVPFPSIPPDFVFPSPDAWVSEQTVGSYPFTDPVAEAEAFIEDAKRRRDLEERRRVYFLQRATDGAIKIGTSARPLSRVYAMRAEHKCHVELLAAMPGGLRQEQLMHARFARSRIDGEWFKPSRFLLAFIDKLNREETVHVRAAFEKTTGVTLPPSSEGRR